MSNSSLVTYTKISPNKTSPRNHVIDTITIHCYVGQVTAKSGCNSSRFVNYNPIKGASCQYVVGFDGSIGLCVDEKDRSWCTSNKKNDNRAVTIEVACNPTHPYVVTDAAYKSLIKLVADICKRNNIKELKWKGDKSLIGQVDKQNMTVHRWFANKACPGDYLYNRHGQIAAEVNKLLGVNTTTTNDSYTLKEFVKDIQSAFGASVDGIAGSETLSKTITISATKNRNHPAVKSIQKRLLELGYSEVGTVDGIAGVKFTSAVKRFQKNNSCVSDGELTAKGNTWRKILGMK